MYQIISRKPDINQIYCSRDTEGEHIHPIPALLMPISASTRDMSATLRQPSMLVSHSRKTACTCSLAAQMKLVPQALKHHAHPLRAIGGEGKAYSYDML